jgi:protein SCO1/2
MRRWRLIVPLLLIASQAGARVDQSAFSELAFRQHPGAQLPLNVPLTDEAGRPVTLGRELAGQPTIFILEYLRCQNLCSLVIGGAVASLKAAQLAPGRQVNLVAVSIDPRDTVRDAAAAKARYVQQFAGDPSAASGLHFLTGKPEEVARIAAAVGFPYRYDRASDQFLHPAGFVVTTPTGNISRYMLGIGPAPDALRAAVVEAGQGAVEPPAHPLLLLCFGYDPDEGTAAALAFRLVRYVSFAAILGLGLLIAFLSLRRRAA